MPIRCAYCHFTHIHKRASKKPLWQCRRKNLEPDPDFVYVKLITTYATNAYSSLINSAYQKLRFSHMQRRAAFLNYWLR